MHPLDLLGLISACVVFWVLVTFAAMAVRGSRSSEDGDVNLFEQLEARVSRERQADAAALMQLNEMEHAARA